MAELCEFATSGWMKVPCRFKALPGLVVCQEHARSDTMGRLIRQLTKDLKRMKAKVNRLEIQLEKADTKSKNI